MDLRVKEISERLESMVEAGHPLSNFVLSFFRSMLEEWRDPLAQATPAPFGDSPLIELVESMLPSVESTDSDSAEMIRGLLDRVRETRDAHEKRTLGYALEWFYLYFTRKTDFEFEAWLEARELEPSH